MNKKYYVYALLDSRKPGYWVYEIEGTEVQFEYEPFYVGKGTGSRVSQHVKETLSKPELKTRKHQKIRSILKEGNVLHKKISTNLENFEALELEVLLIETIGRVEKNGPLVNLTNGGDGLSEPSDEVRRKISESSKNRVVSESTKEKLKQNWINKLSLVDRIVLKRGLSKKEAEEIVTKLNQVKSEKMKKYRHTEEAKQKISVANKGRKKIFSENHRKAISKSKKGVFLGEKNPMYGKTFYNVWDEKYGSEVCKEKTKERNDFIKKANYELETEADKNFPGSYSKNVKIKAYSLLKSGHDKEYALQEALRLYKEAVEKGTKAKQELDKKKFWEKVQTGEQKALETLQHCKVLLNLKESGSVDLTNDFNKVLCKKGRRQYLSGKVQELENKIKLYGVTL